GHASAPPLAASGCGVPRSQQAEITIDGQPGRIAQCANRVEATVVAGGRLYLFVLSHGARSDARAFFDAWVATIHLTPRSRAPPVRPGVSRALGRPPPPDPGDGRRALKVPGSSPPRARSVHGASARRVR